MLLNMQLGPKIPRKKWMSQHYAQNHLVTIDAQFDNCVQCWMSWLSLTLKYSTKDNDSSISQTWRECITPTLYAEALAGHSVKVSCMQNAEGVKHGNFHKHLSNTMTPLKWSQHKISTICATTFMMTIIVLDTCLWQFQCLTSPTFCMRFQDNFTE